MSTTEAKRDVIDYLWDWAEGAGNWAKLLVHKVCLKKKMLWSKMTGRKFIRSSYMISDL